MKREEERRIEEHLIVCTDCHALIDEELDFTDQIRGAPAFQDGSMPWIDSSLAQLFLILNQFPN